MSAALVVAADCQTASTIAAGLDCRWRVSAQNGFIPKPEYPAAGDSLVQVGGRCVVKKKNVTAGSYIDSRACRLADSA